MCIPAKGITGTIIDIFAGDEPIVQKQTKSGDEAQEDNDAIAMAMALLVIENTHLREVIHHLRDTISGLTDHNLL